MKLVNNLQIEQLLKTDWANQFNQNQLYRIREGLNHNLDVSIYANKIHSAYLMKLARLLLIAGADLKPCILRKRLDLNKLLSLHQYYLRLKKVEALNFHELRLLQMYPYKRED